MDNFKTRNNQKYCCQTSVSKILFLGTAKSTADKRELILDSADDCGIFSLIICNDNLKQNKTKPIQIPCVAVLVFVEKALFTVSIAKII